MTYDLRALRAALERRRRQAPQPAVVAGADDIVAELRDLKAVLVQHHNARPIPSGG